MKKDNVVPIYEVPKNVNEFLDRASEAYGKYKADEFSQLRWMECDRIASPIEQLFAIAIHLVSEVNLVYPRIVAAFDDKSDDLLIVPQWPTSAYRVDFALRRHPIDQIVCVELDGHAFHDRNERQRRYEKRRDRYLTASGYKTLHFTGAEVAADPCACALEAFNLATGLQDASIHPFEND
jgi:very-short-patch-repair endonuclease